MNRVVHFEIHADDPKRAIEFYATVFGWEFTQLTSAEGYWVINTGPRDQAGIDGGLIKRLGTIDGTAVLAYVCTIHVASVDAAVAKVISNGGSLAVPKMAIPGVGWLAYCKDTERNVFGVTHEDRLAR